MCNDVSQDWVFPAQVYLIHSHRHSFLFNTSTRLSISISYFSIRFLILTLMYIVSDGLRSSKLLARLKRKLMLS